MKFYNYKKIDEMVQPLIKMMQKEYPNDAQLTIDSNSAKIQYVHEELMFLESSLMPNKGDENGLKEVFFKALGRIGIWREVRGQPHLMECSVCHTTSLKGNFDFCPKCGSRNEKAEKGAMPDCEWMQDEMCVNDQSPMCADYCPVPDVEGVCRFEERSDGK